MTVEKQILFYSIQIALVSILVPNRDGLPVADNTDILFIIISFALFLQDSGSTMCAEVQSESGEHP